MIWQDLLLDRWVDETALHASTVSTFGVPTDAVAVVDDPAQMATLPATTRIILQRDRQHRDFPLQVLVIVRDDELLRRFDGFEGALRVTRDLAGRLGATVLFAEGPVSPSEWVRVSPAGRVDVVSLDVDETGDVDSFFVVAEHELRARRRSGKRRTTRLTA